MSERRVPRVLLVVCDSWGVGDAPDADAYGDAGADTLGEHVARGGRPPRAQPRGARARAPHHDRGSAAACRRRIRPRTRHRAIGRQGHHDRALGDDGDPARASRSRCTPTGSRRRSSSRSRKRSAARSWATCRRRAPRSSRSWARSTSRTGKPIVYTSGDSVFQIATHKDVVPLATLYEWSRVARRLLTGEHTVGRVIARPFEGQPGAFVRSPERRDFAVPPPGPTVLDRLQAAGVAVYGVGKIRDIFSGQGITEGRYSDSNDHGVDLTLEYLRRPAPSFVFTNLVDFDSKYGHRNDAGGLREGDRGVRSAAARARSARSTAASCSSPATTAATRPLRRPTTRASGPRCWPPGWPAARTRSGPGSRSAISATRSPSSSGSRSRVSTGRSFADRIGIRRDAVGDPRDRRGAQARRPHARRRTTSRRSSGRTPRARSPMRSRRRSSWRACCAGSTTTRRSR